MGLEQDRKQLAAKQKDQEEYKRKAAKLRTDEADKLGDVAKAQAAANDLAKEAKAWERKADSVAADIKRLRAKVTKAEAALAPTRK